MLKEIVKDKTFFGMLSTVAMLSLVSAQGFYEIKGGFENALGFLFGGIDGAYTGEILFIKLLIFVVILSIVNLAVGRVPGFGDKKGISLVISVAVSMMAVRYITTTSLINFIWLPYGVIGVLFSSILPFIIGFFFFQGFDSSIIRKVGWTGFFVIFIGLGWMRWNDFTADAWFGNLAWIYIIIAGISALLIFYDRNIHALFIVNALGKAGNRRARIEAAELADDIAGLKERLARADSRTADDINEEIREKKRRINNLLRS